jgi:hypothetical protein
VSCSRHSCSLFLISVLIESFLLVFGVTDTDPDAVNSLHR